MQSFTEKLIGVISYVVLILAFAFGFAALLAWPVKVAINGLFAPSFLLTVFGVAKLGFWQTFVLLFVTGSLFKSSTSSGGKK